MNQNLNINHDFNKLAGSTIEIEVDNHEEMEKHAKLWNLNEVQIEEGSFEASIKAILTPFTQLGDISRSRGVTIKGNTPKHCYAIVYFYTKYNSHITHNGLPVTEQELVVLDDTDKIDVMSSRGYNSVTVTIQKEYFDRMYKDCFNTSFNYEKKNKRIQLKENRGEHLKHRLLHLLEFAMKDKVKLRNDPDFLHDIERKIIQILFQNIDPIGIKKSPLSSEKSADILRTYLNLYFAEDLSIKQIASDLQMSERTVRQGFNTLFGMSPKKYLLHYRLGKVHKALLAANGNNDHVESIAHDHGFYHMGHFARRYNIMFKEYPLDTLLKHQSTTNTSQ